jgi:cytochrome c2
VPSIGISAIIAPNPQEFSNWKGSLVLCSLRANTLYIVKTEGDDIVYVEPIPMNNYRLRDVASLPDGRLAILVDGGTLLLLRNAELHRGEAQHVQITGLSSLPRPSPDEAMELMLQQISPAGAAERGRRFFLGSCATCHSLAGEAGIGPPLNGIVGRRFAAFPGFAYSTALKARSDIWTEALVSSFINNSTGLVPGTSMPKTGLFLEQADDVAAYLKTTRGP